MEIKSKCLFAVINGTAIECGSGCYQDSEGQRFFGRMSPEGIEEAIRILDDARIKKGIRRICKRVIEYEVDTSVRRWWLVYRDARRN